MPTTKRHLIMLAHAAAHPIALVIKAVQSNVVDIAPVLKVVQTSRVHIALVLEAVQTRGVHIALVLKAIRIVSGVPSLLGR